MASRELKVALEAYVGAVLDNDLDDGRTANSALTIATQDLWELFPVACVPQEQRPGGTTGG
jgi:hypothetical protein